jgi:hypothetical protein
MNTVKDRLQAATRAAADTVAPGSAPPLRLPETAGAGRSLLTRRPGQPWARTIAPLAAAAAVTAVVAASLAVTGGFSNGRPGASGAQASRPGAHAAPQVLSAADRAALASVPQFYVALNPGAMGHNDRAQVRATATGTVLVTVSAPAPYNTWSWVTAAADDRTFVLAAQEWTPIPRGNAGTAIENKDDDTPTKFFVLHLSADGRTARLSALPIPLQPGSVWVDGIALSPDGSKLAMVVNPNNAAKVNPAIAVFTVATGAKKEWTWLGSAFIGNGKPWGSPLSWTADGRTLAFQITPADGIIEVRLLDTDAPGGLMPSRLGVEWARGGVTGARGQVITGSDRKPGNSLGGFNTLITPDGTKIVCETTGPAAQGITEFDSSTARVASVTYPQGTDVLWANANGSTLIVSNATTAGVLAGTHFTPLPDASDVDIMSAW